MSPGLFNYSKQNKTMRYLLNSRKCCATIKADQINGLRKQYDAFLEEDKKRKERNEHILGKLDSMRLSNTVARYKSNVYLDQRVSFNCIGEAPMKACPHLHATQPAIVNPLRKCNDTAMSMELDVLTKPMDETYILNEISKKYILIPKLRSIAGADYIPKPIKQDNNNDSDWKSKYSILDTLKQKEKEETSSFAVLKDNGKSFLDDIPTKEHKYRLDDEKNSPIGEIAEMRIGMISKKYDTNPLACLDEKGTYQMTTDVTKETPNVQTEETPKLKTHSTTFKTDTDSGGHLQQSERGPTDIEVATHQYTYPMQNMSEQSASHDTSDRHNDATYKDKYENEDNEKLSPVVDDIRHVEEIDPIKPDAQNTNAHLNTGDSEKLQYPIDIINVQDFTPAEGVALLDGVNINPDNHAVQQSYLAPPSDQYPAQAPTEQAYQPEANQPHSDVQYVTHPIGSSEQVDLPGANQLSGGDHYVSEPTESSEQVYLPGDQQPLSGDQYVTEQVAVAAEQQEHVKENPEQQQQVAYDQTGDVTSDIQAFEDEQNQMFYSEQTNYQDQNAVGDVYSVDANYDPTIYYGGVQQEAYPVEINEHEETSQRYDPSYEEQYTEQQQYGEQQYSDQQYGEQQYDGQQPYGDQMYDQQQYAEQQHYTDQPHEGQIEGDPTMVATLQEYDPAYTLQEQTMEEIEQQLDKEELNVPSQAAGDITDESTLYAQNAGEEAVTEQYVENQNPQPIS